MKNVIMYILLLLGLYSCHTDVSSYNKYFAYDSVRYGNKKLRIVWYKNPYNDSGYEIHYTYEGWRVDSFTRYGNRIEGPGFHYDSLGNLVAQNNYKQGLREGWQFEYYANGTPSAKSLFHEDKKYGDLYFYYKNGKIFEYRCYDFDEKYRRYKIYDSVGSVFANEGLVVGQVQAVGSIGHYTFKEHNGANLNFMISLAPNERTTLETFFKGHEKNKEEQIIKQNLFNYSNSSLKAGDYSLIVIGTSVDTITKSIKKDTIEASFRIIK